MSYPREPSTTICDGLAADEPMLGPLQDILGGGLAVNLRYLQRPHG